MDNKVYSLSRQSPEKEIEKRHHPNISFITGSRETLGPNTARLPHIDMAYHLTWAGSGSAGRANLAIQDNDHQNSRRLLSLVDQNGFNLFIFGGSQGEYGPLASVVNESAKCNPDPEYGRAKNFPSALMLPNSAKKGRCPIGWREYRVFLDQEIIHGLLYRH